ncbi:MAG: hypothetical protein HKO10_06755 [Acidimicrobiia bacterium]|nr:hypothetical protein [Acidimicrobiia bacterium]NNF63921.1 hypothetical protein [Acidimicrobiia bacterium]
MSGPSAISRRTALKRGAALAGATAWAIPTIQIVGMSRAFAQAVSADGPDAAHWSVRIADVVCNDGAIETIVIEFAVDREVHVTGIQVSGRTVVQDTRPLDLNTRPLQPLSHTLTSPRVTGLEGELSMTFTYIADGTDVELTVDFTVDIECPRS